MIKPNTFIIGAQKSATTSLYNWLAQHPNICGPSSIKDHPFFIKDEHLKEGVESLKKEYLNEGYLNQKIILQGSVQYMFEEKAIENIFEFDPNAKLISILRNPTDRAISAYNFFKKINLETLSFKTALEIENERMKGTFRERIELTYKAHGLYAQQLEKVFKKFKKKQILILFYEDIRDNPELTLSQTFRFLNVDSDFTPNFKILNKTGDVKYRFLQNLFFNNNKVKKYIINNFVDPFLPLHKRTNLKLLFREWNTKKRKNKPEEANFTEEKLILKNYFKDDIIKLEKLTGRNLDAWK